LQKKIIDMRWTAPLSPRRWLLGQGIWETVQMPVKTAKAARNDHAIWLRSSAVTIMTKDRFSFGIFQAEIIWGFIIASTVVPTMLSA